ATGANAILFAGTTGKDVAGSNRVAEPAASTGNTVNSNLITDVPIGVVYNTNAYGTAQANFINSGVATTGNPTPLLNVGVLAGNYAGPATATVNGNSVATTGALFVQGNQVIVNPASGATLVGGVQLDNNQTTLGAANNTFDIGKATFGVSD